MEILHLLDRTRLYPYQVDLRINCCEHNSRQDELGITSTPNVMTIVYQDVSHGGQKSDKRPTMIVQYDYGGYDYTVCQHRKESREGSRKHTLSIADCCYLLKGIDDYVHGPLESYSHRETRSTLLSRERALRMDDSQALQSQSTEAHIRVYP